MERPDQLPGTPVHPYGTAHRVCVFAASSEHVSARYRALARDLGRAIAEQGWQVVYGGGQVGLMGEVARAALAAGGHVVGIIPHHLNRREVAFDEVTELVMVDTLLERKSHMDSRSDAFAVLPGGIGTLDELLDVLTTRALGFHRRPLVLLDPDGYWEPFRALLDRMIDQRTASPAVHEGYAVARTVDDAVQRLRPG